MCWRNKQISPQKEIFKDLSFLLCLQLERQIRPDCSNQKTEVQQEKREQISPQISHYTSINRDFRSGSNDLWCPRANRGGKRREEKLERELGIPLSCFCCCGCCCCCSGSHGFFFWNPTLLSHELDEDEEEADDAGMVLRLSFDLAMRRRFLILPDVMFYIPKVNDGKFPLENDPSI